MKKPVKTSAYMDRALKARDPRYARVLGKLGYDRRDMQAAEVDPEPEVDELTAVRAEYEEAVGKRAYHGWDIPTLRQKMAEATAESEGE